MNWMGGARNRVKFQGEKKIQKEFFDRKRLNAASSTLGRNCVQKKLRLSQDLMALHTVSRTHSQKHEDTSSSSSRAIKSVNLDKFQSCTRQIEDVDMGPCSPTFTAPSKILIQDNEMCNRSIEVVPKLHTKTTVEDTFLRPKVQSDDRQYNRHNHSDNRNEKQVESSRTILPSPVKALPEKDECESTKLSTFSFSSSKENVNKRKQSKLDMFVSEDFQTTPLIKYGNQSTVSKHQLKQRPMFDSLKLDKGIHKQTQKRSKQKTFTSTPLKNSHYQKQLDNNIHNSTSVENLSPIQKYLPYYTNGTSGFKYTSRLMMTPEKGKVCASSTPSLTDIPEYHKNTQDGHLGGKKKNHNNSKRHNNSSISDTYAIDTETLMPNSNTQNKDYYSDLSVDKNIFSTECVSMTTDSSVYPLSDYETTGSSLSTYKISLTKDDTDHSLSHYQENDNSTCDAKSKSPNIKNTKLNFPSTTEKPTFTSLEDDFVYMPLNTRASRGLNAKQC